MKTLWVQGLEADIAKEIRGDFKSSHLVRKRLTTILEDKIATNRKASLDKDGYDVANWAMKQADRIGYERALEMVISLVSDSTE